MSFISIHIDDLLVIGPKDFINDLHKEWCATVDIGGTPDDWHSDEENYFLSSVPVCNYFAIMPVPRVPDALDDYRWNLLMQGPGPEGLVVENCRNLSNYIINIPLESDPFGIATFAEMVMQFAESLGEVPIWTPCALD